MRLSTITGIALCLAVCCVSTAATRPTPTDEKTVIEKTIRDSICWALTKDRPLAESTLAHDENLFYFWIKSAYTVMGWKQHVKTFDTFMDPRFKAIRTDVRDLHIYLSPSGDVAWYDATLDDVSEWDGRRGGAENINWTGVLEKREGKWVIVHMHASLSSDKAVADSKARLQIAGADALQAARDYIEGWYEGDASRVDKILHPSFVRRIAAVTVAGDDFFWNQDRTEFIEGIRRGGDKATPVDQRQIKTEVLDLARTTATVRVDSAYYVEYLSMVKLRDRWQVVNVLWENVPNDKVEVEIDTSVLAEYAGVYRHEKGSEWKVSVEGNRLFLRQGDAPRIEFFPESKTDFFTKGYKSSITFVRDASGKVTQFVKHLNYRDFIFVRIN